MPDIDPSAADPKINTRPWHRMALRVTALIVLLSLTACAQTGDGRPAPEAPMTGLALAETCSALDPLLTEASALLVGRIVGEGAGAEVSDELTHYVAALEDVLGRAPQALQSDLSAVIKALDRANEQLGSGVAVTGYEFIGTSGRVRATCETTGIKTAAEQKAAIEKEAAEKEAAIEKEAAEKEAAAEKKAAEKKAAIKKAAIAKKAALQAKIEASYTDVERRYLKAYADWAGKTNPAKALHKGRAACKKTGSRSSGYSRARYLLNHAGYTDIAVKYLCTDYMPDLRKSERALYEGDYSVGKKARPGTYRTEPRTTDCYWERNSRGGDIIANDLITFAASGATVTILSSDGGFSTTGCGPWIPL